MNKAHWILWTALLTASWMMAGDAASQENEARGAEEAFASEDYAEAARRYEVLRKTRGESAPLLYNLGTAWSHAGASGKAIWALEKARLMAPDDAQILHNLDVTRQRVRVERVSKSKGLRLTEGEPDGVFLFRTFSALGKNGFLWLLWGSNVLGFALLVLRRRYKEGGARDGLNVAVVLCLVVALASASILLARDYVMDDVKVGVALAEKARLRNSPVSTARAQRHPDLYAGAVVQVMEVRSDGWMRIHLVDETEGWVKEKEVGLLLP